MSQETPQAHAPGWLAHELTMTVLMTPDMANFTGNVHGGTILKYLDSVAHACASRYSGSYVGTLSVDQVMFLQPIHVGELVTFLASVTHRQQLDGSGDPGRHRKHPAAHRTPCEQLLLHDGCSRCPAQAGAGAHARAGQRRAARMLGQAEQRKLSRQSLYAQRQMKPLHEPARPAPVK